MKTTKIADNIWKFTGFDDVNAYFLDIEQKIFIDCGNPTDADEFKSAVSKIIEPSKIDIVLFTHLHYDHSGNHHIFSNAEFYASETEIKYLKEKAQFYECSEDLSKLIKPLPEQIAGLRVIPTPYHTDGSVCFMLDSQKIIFTGDTYFRRHMYGRDDLINSVPEKKKESLDKIRESGAELILPGHDY